MSQGKKFTLQQRDTILEGLRPYLQLGYSVNKACELTEQDPSTVYKWIQGDEALSRKVEAWQGMVNAVARQNLVKSIQGDKEKGIEPNLENSKWWLERRDKKEFGQSTADVAVQVNIMDKEIKDRVDNAINSYLENK